eukprot:408637-Rhodomonas_salina.1
MWYTLCGTEIISFYGTANGYGVFRLTGFASYDGTTIGYGATRCAVLSHGTDAGHGATRVVRAVWYWRAGIRTRRRTRLRLLRQGSLRCDARVASWLGVSRLVLS